MKKITFMICALAAAISVAGIKDIKGYGYSEDAVYMQFTHDEVSNTGNYVDARHPDQNWLGAQTITLKIDSPCDVWISNYVSSWYWPKPINALDGNVFDMSNYGATDVNGKGFWKGSGETATVTYFDDATGATNQTEGYYLGHFEGGEELSIWMTTLASDGGETVNMTQYVSDENHDTTLASRVDGTHDLAGNVRINFGLTNMIGREFVAFGVSDPNKPQPGVFGQPLPGVALAGLLAMGSIVAARKMKKRD